MYIAFIASLFFGIYIFLLLLLFLLVCLTTTTTKKEACDNLIHLIVYLSISAVTDFGPEDITTVTDDGLKTHPRGLNLW